MAPVQRTAHFESMITINLFQKKNIQLDIISITLQVKAIITFQYGVFFLRPKVDFIQAVTITKRTQILRHQQEFS